MTEKDYRLVGVEFVRQVESLLIHIGSRQALSIAESWANGESFTPEALQLARNKAMKACAQCVNEARDGRAHAAEAAWQLLAPSAQEWIRQIAENVAKALAAKIVIERRSALTPETQDEFEYVRAVELELLEDLLLKHEGKT